MKFKYWDKQQIKTFVKNALESVGGRRAAALLLTDTLREAVIAQYALAVVCGQAKETIEIESVEELRLAMRIEAGLWEETNEGKKEGE